MRYCGPSTASKSRLIFSRPFFLLWIVVVYGWLFFLLPVNGFWMNDNGLKFIQLQAILINRFKGFFIPWAGKQLDPLFLFSPIKAPFGKLLDDHLFVSYPPLFTFLSAFPYRFLGMRGLYVIPLLGSLLLFISVMYLGEAVCQDPEHRLKSGRVAVLLTAFASPVIFYSFTFWEHTVALAFCCWSLLAGVQYCRCPSVHAIVKVGLLAGLAICFRTEAYLFSAVIAAVCCRISAKSRWRNGLVLIGAFAAVLIPLWIFQWWATGSLMGLHIQSQNWGDLTPALFLSQRLTVAANLLLNMHRNAIASMLLAGPFLFMAMFSWKRLNILWTPVIVLALAALSGGYILYGHMRSEQPLTRLFFSNGLFAVSPVLILGFLVHTVHGQYADAGNDKTGDTKPCAWPGLGKDRLQAHRFIMTVLYLYVLSYVAFIPEINSLGVHWGCRFLLIAYPVLCCLSAPVIIFFWYRSPQNGGVMRLLILLATGISLMQQVYALDLLRHRQQFSSRLAAQVRLLKPEIIITPDWHLPHDLALVFYDQPIFLIKDDDSLNSLLRAAHRQNIGKALLICKEGSMWGPDNVIHLSDDGLNFSPVMIWELNPANDLLQNIF